MDAKSTLAVLALLVSALPCRAEESSQQHPADTRSECKQIEDTIFYAPNDPMMTEAKKDALRDEWYAKGCAPPGEAQRRIQVRSMHEVTVYYAPPNRKYRELGQVEASSEGSWGLTPQQKSDKVINSLKAQAFSRGANGILLVGIGKEYGGTVSSASGHVSASGGQNYGSAYGSVVGTSTPIFHKSGSAIAIFVTNELAAEATALPPPPDPATAAGRTNTIYDELNKLDDLRKRGLISDEEFAAEKRRILSRK